MFTRQSELQCLIKFSKYKKILKIPEILNLITTLPLKIVRIVTLIKHPDSSPIFRCPRLYWIHNRDINRARETKGHVLPPPHDHNLASVTAHDDGSQWQCAPHSQAKLEAYRVPLRLLFSPISLQYYHVNTWRHLITINYNSTVKFECKYTNNREKSEIFQ